MSRRAAALAFATIVVALSAPPALAAAAAAPGPRPSPIVIVVDTSGSMNESDGSSSGRIKIDGAKVALLDFLQQIEPNTPIGLRNYPAEGEASGEEEGCSAGKRQLEVAPRNPTAMAATIRTLRADGDTPTAAALKAAADDLSASGASQGTIVLVSDGESNCGRDPCDVAREIGESGVDLQTITVGFRVSGAGAKELQCIADQTGGKYLSVHDNEGLAEAFDEISRPRIELKVDYPPLVTAQVGNDPSGLVRIEAEIANAGQRLAVGAVARIRFDAAAGAPAVVRPVVYLGNLAPGESRKVSWTFRPGVPPRDNNPMPLPFAVIAGAQNTLADAELKATIRVSDAFATAAQAGPILRSRPRIAIFGDSYSAGEGADAYLRGTDTDANACHRSHLTYLAPAFNLPDANIIACSGAVTGDVRAPQGGQGVPPQVEQLEDLLAKSRTDSVVMTMGGNDVGFRQIAQSCLIGRSDCAHTIYEDVPFWQRKGKASDQFVGERIKALPESLRRVYLAINDIVNGPDARATHGPVPILVLAYPLPTPLTPQSCLSMVDLLAPDEIDFLDRLIVRLNGVVEAAVKEARKDGVPAFFVPNTEMAFQPDHTLCDRAPYARNVKSFNGAGIDPESLVKALKASVWQWPPLPNPVSAFKAALKVKQVGLAQIERSFQELVHPNRAGYEAETRAILRWSQSPDATAAVQFLESAPVAKPLTLKVTSSGDDLGQLAPGATPLLQGGTSYPLNLQGFAPDSALTIGVHSDFRVLAYATADGTGAISTRVVIPDGIEPGDHTLTVSGASGDGKPRSVEIPFQIAGGGPPTLVTALLWAGIAGVAVTVVLALVLLGLGRRRDRLGEVSG
jgi:lysophospholipase L1-like esterase